MTFAIALGLALVPITVASAETFDNPHGNFNWKVYLLSSSSRRSSRRR